MSFRPYKRREHGSTKDLAARLIGAAGGVKKAALLVERSPTQTLSYTDPQTPDQISLDLVRRLALGNRDVATIAAEDLAAIAGGVFLPEPAAGESFDILAVEGAKDWGEFTASLLRMHAANKLHELDNERDALKRLDKLMHALALMRSQLIAKINATKEA